MTTPTPTYGEPVARFGDLSFHTLQAGAFSRAVSLFEVELAPGCLAGPLHVHKHEDAISYVLSAD